MKIYVGDAIKLLLAKVYVDKFVANSIGNSEEANQLVISAFTELTLDLLSNGSDGIIRFNDIINKLNSILSQYITIDLSMNWIELTSRCELSKVDDKIILDLREDDRSSLYRQTSKLLIMPSFVKIQNNNVSFEEDYSFEITYRGMSEDEVLTNLTAVIHNAYNRSFVIPSGIEYSNLANVTLFTNSPKKLLLNVFNNPFQAQDIESIKSKSNTNKPKPDLIVDAKYLMPKTVYKLTEWLKKTTNRRIILISPRSNLSLVKFKIFEGLSVESYIIE